jgi:streptogramin lyase
MDTPAASMIPPRVLMRHRRRSVVRQPRLRLTGVRVALVAASLAIITGGRVESASAAEPLGSITEFTAGLNAGSSLNVIATGPDGNLWFTDQGSTKAIGRITTAGQITEFSDGLNRGSSPNLIAAGPDGNLWFTDGGSTPAIGLITTTGQITGFSAGLNAGSEPVGIAAGADGNLWFTDDGGTAAIGRIGAAPSNAFSFGKLKRNKRRGTATLPVKVPGPGTLALSGKGLVEQSRAAGVRGAPAEVVSAASQIQLRIVSKGKKKRALNRDGKVKLNAKITYTPTGGSPNTQSRLIKLIKRG